MSRLEAAFVQLKYIDLLSLCLTMIAPLAVAQVTIIMVQLYQLTPADQLINNCWRVIMADCILFAVGIAGFMIFDRKPKPIPVDPDAAFPNASSHKYTKPTPEDLTETAKEFAKKL